MLMTTEQENENLPIDMNLFYEIEFKATWNLFRPLFLKAIGAVPATAAAAVAPGYEIEFGKHPVVSFFIIMYALNEISAPAGKGILLFQGYDLVEFLQTFRAKAVVKRVGEKGFGFVA